jgi:hypothetical protein
VADELAIVYCTKPIITVDHSCTKSSAEGYNWQIGIMYAYAAKSDPGELFIYSCYCKDETADGFLVLARRKLGNKPATQRIKGQ